MGRDEVGQNGGSSSGSRLTRTRLQGGPVWTLQDMLILVNEIAAVEGDCQDALSSYQKWAIIAENCTALEVVRNANQCRRKWESLLADFSAVKEWESSSRGDSYWSLVCEKRQEVGLPVEFDEDLYKAIDDFTRATKQANTDTECDSEAEATETDALNTVPSGSKPKRVINRSTPQKSRTVERKQLAFEEEHEKPVHIVKETEQIKTTKLENIKAGSKHKRVINRSTPRKSKIIGRKQLALKEKHDKPVPIVKEMEQRMSTKLENMNTVSGPKRKKIKLESSFERSVSTKRKQVPLEEEDEKHVPVLLEEEHEKHVLLLESEEQILARKLQENTELIHAILAGVNNNIVDEDMSGLINEETLKTERVKCKADKLIASLTDLAKNLEQLCDVVKEY